MRTPRWMIGLVSTIGGSVLLLGGCQQPRPHTLASDEVAAYQYPKVVVLHPVMAKDLVLSPAVVESTTRTSTMAVRVPIRSIRDYPIAMQYRITFFAQGQRLLTPQPAWQSLTLGPRQRAVVQANALSMDAVDWQLELRPQ